MQIKGTHIRDKSPANNWLQLELRKEKAALVYFHLSGLTDSLAVVSQTPNITLTVGVRQKQYCSNHRNDHTFPSSANSSDY